MSYSTFLGFNFQVIYEVIIKLRLKLPSDDIKEYCNQIAR
jgi:hypothetical protein